jgi:hypothetical protein
MFFVGVKLCLTNFILPKLSTIIITIIYIKLFVILVFLRTLNPLSQGKVRPNGNIAITITLPFDVLTFSLSPVIPIFRSRLPTQMKRVHYYRIALRCAGVSFSPTIGYARPILVIKVVSRTVLRLRFTRKTNNCLFKDKQNKPHSGRFPNAALYKTAW